MLVFLTQAKITMWIFSNLVKNDNLIIQPLPPSNIFEKQLKLRQFEIVTHTVTLAKIISESYQTGSTCFKFSDCPVGVCRLSIG